MGDIGKPVKEIEFEPLDDPIEAPVPAAPEPSKVPEPLPV